MHKSHPINPRTAFLSALLAVVALPVPCAVAETYNWSGPVTGTQSWNVNANWGGSGFPVLAGDVANLAVDLTGNQTVNLVVPVTVGSLTFGDSSGAQTQTIAPGAGGTLTFDNLGSGASLTRGGDGTGTSTISAPIVLADTLTITNQAANGTLSLAGGISGPAGIIKTGTGRTIASGTNTYSGDTVVNEGFFQASGASIPAGYGRGSIQVNGSGRFEIAGATTNINALSGDGSVGLFGGIARILAIGISNASSTFSGQFVPGTDGGVTTDVLHVTKLRNGTLTLNPTTGYVNTGNMSVDGGNGAIIFDFANMETPTDLVNPASSLVFGGGSMIFRGKTGDGVFTSQTSNNPITLNRGSSALVVDQNGGGGTTLNLNGATITRNATSSIDFSVNGANSAINSPVANDAAGIIGGFATFGGGSTWAIQTGLNTIGGLANGSYLTTSSAGTDANNYTATSNVDVDSSPGQLSAGVTVSTLRFNTAAAHTLTLQGVNTTNGILVTGAVGANESLITGGAIQGANVGGAAAKDLIVHQHNPDGALHIASQITDNAGATGLTKSGPGLLKVSNPANNYTGTTYVGEGTVQLGASDVIPDAARALLFTTLDLNGFNETLLGMVASNNGVVTNSSANPSVLTINGGAGSANATVIDGVIQDGAGKVSLVKSGASTMTLGQNMGPENTFSGTTTINSGSGLVTLNNSGALKNSTVTFASGTLVFGSVVTSKEFTLGGLSGSGNLALVSTAPAAPITLRVGNNGEQTSYSGVLSGGGSLVKIGAGTTTLAGNNTYTGTTTVSAGSLLVNGSHTGAGAYTVESGGTLGGSGSISSSLAVNTGGVVAPGEGVGILTVNSADIAGTLAIEFNGDTDIIDRLNVGTSLDIAGATISFSNLGTATLSGGPHVFASYGSLTGGSFGSVLGLPAGYSINYNYLNSNQIALVAGLAGDFDLDGDVDGADFVAWQTNFPTTSGATRPQGDSDSDGDVDGADFASWQSSFPSGNPGTSPVPEPQSWALCVFGLAALGAYRRRGRK